MNALTPTRLPRIISLPAADKQDMRIARLERLVDAMRTELKVMRVALEDTVTGSIPVPVYARGVREIIDCAAIKYGFTSAQIIGPDRMKWLSHARQEAMCVAYEAGFSLPLIGRVMGGRDHTTILHGVHAHRARMAV